MGKSEVLTRPELEIEEAVREVVKIGLRFEHQGKMAEAASKERHESISKTGGSEQARQDHGREEAGAGEETGVVPGQ
jgi:hypothetical protein